jgi:hydrophobic/amphiphilic exporter-1 (mainly G- bacteria), HAE1 family
MTLPELSIRRHVLAVMLSAVLLLFGAIALQQVGTAQMPNVDFGVVHVMVVMPGADPEIMNASVTTIVERAVNTVPGIDHIQSFSSPGVSNVTIIFNLEKDVDVAFTEVQAQLSAVRRQLPEDAEEPVVMKVHADAQPIMWVSLRGDRTLQQLGTYARNVIRPQLENIDGVGEVMVGGGRSRNIRIEVDPHQLTAFQLTVDDLIEAVRAEHVQMPGGFLVADESERLIKLDLEYHHPEALADLIVTAQNGALVRLRDLATVIDGMADPRSLARFNGEPSVGLGIVKISGTNTVAIIDEVHRRLDSQIRPQLPAGMRIDVATDQAQFIIEMIDTLNLTILLATLFAALVLWVFLKNLRSTVIVVLSIPISLAAIIATVYFFGYTLNTVTMLAMLLLIGVVVDDSIVILENIYRHREEGIDDPVRGAVVGANEVFFAVIATTLALVAIFLPVLFMGGIIGRFFESFAVVVTMGVLASSLVALTLTPMLCSRYLHISKQHGRVYNVLERGFRALEGEYRRLLYLALRFRWSTLAVAALTALVSASLLGQLGGEFAPEQDEGQFLVSLQTPLGSSIDYTDAKLKATEEILGAQEGVASFFSAIGLGGGPGRVNQAIAFVRLDARAERRLSQREIVGQVQRQLADVPGVRAFAAPVPMMGGGQRGEPLQFNIRGPDLNEVARLAEELERRLRRYDEIGTLDLTLNLDLPELALEVDRESVRQLGLTTRQVARAANILVGGVDIARYNDRPGDGERYDVRMKARDGTFRSPDDLNQLFLRAANGEMVRLDTVARFEPRLGPAVVNRFDLQYAADFYSNPSAPLAGVVELVRAEAGALLPVGYSLNLIGQAEEFERTAAAIVFVFTLAIVLVYMVLASQFNSFLQPMVILAALPLAMIGGILGLWLFNHTLNAYSMIGLVLLVGLVTKNGILLVDLTNQYRNKRGLSIDDALTAACPIRLRPILMTSLTLILAMLPAAVGLGAGAEEQGPIVVVIITGMVSSMLLTLVVVPAAYSLLEHGARRLRRVNPLSATPASRL